MLALVFALACRNPAPDTDTDTPTDTANDTDQPDTGTTDTSADTGEDVDSDTGDDEPPPWSPPTGCDYLDLSVYAVGCGGDSPSELVEWVSMSGDPACPTWYALNGAEGLDASAVIAAATCDDTCVWRMHQSVMLLYCDVRGEYIDYLADGPGQDGDGSTCGSLAWFGTVVGSGWATDLEAWSAEHPCPER